MADTDQTDQTTDATSDDQTTDATSEQTTLGDKGKAALDAERQARKDAEKRAKEAEKRIADLDKERQDAADEQAHKNGEFEKLATDRQTKLDEATGTIATLTEERDALKAQVDAYQQRDTERLEAALKDLPDDLKGTDPVNFDPDVSLAARLKWLDVQQATAAKRTTDPVKGNGRNPGAANGHDPKDDEKARIAFAQRYQ